MADSPQTPSGSTTHAASIPDLEIVWPDMNKDHKAMDAYITTNLCTASQFDHIDRMELDAEPYKTYLRPEGDRLTRATLYSNGREFREIKLWWPRRLFDGEVFIGEPDEDSRESEDATDDDAHHATDDNDNYSMAVAETAVPTGFDSYDHSNLEEMQSDSSATSTNAEPETPDSTAVEATSAEKIEKLKAKYPTVEKVLVSLHKKLDERVLNQQSDMLPSIDGVLQKKLAAEDEVTLTRVPWQLLNR